MGISRRHTEMNEKQIKSYVQARKKKVKYDWQMNFENKTLLISLHVITKVIELF